MNDDARVTYITNSQIKFKTTMLKSRQVTVTAVIHMYLYITYILLEQEQMLQEET